jgi:NAD-dependent deacetylase
VGANKLPALWFAFRVLLMDKPAFEIPEKLANILRGARRLVALTGAGISAESGVPTFRESQTGL